MSGAGDAEETGGCGSVCGRKPGDPVEAGCPADTEKIELKLGKCWRLVGPERA
jgi:hypothetical protein